MPRTLCWSQMRLHCHNASSEFSLRSLIHCQDAMVTCSLLFVLNCGGGGHSVYHIQCQSDFWKIREQSSLLSDGSVDHLTYPGFGELHIRASGASLSKQRFHALLFSSGTRLLRSQSLTRGANVPNSCGPNRNRPKVSLLEQSDQSRWDLERIGLAPIYVYWHFWGGFRPTFGKFTV